MNFLEFIHHLVARFHFRRWLEEMHQHERQVASTNLIESQDLQKSLCTWIVHRNKSLVANRTIENKGPNIVLNHDGDAWMEPILVKLAITWFTKASPETARQYALSRGQRRASLSYQLGVICARHRE
jgi:hypothetical protein